ncbi:MAG: MFS transporter [Bacteroidota bacterium]
MADTQLTKSTSKRNYYAFLWHAVFLALAQNFMDVDTIVPSMIVDAGGGSFHIGLLTAIMLGGSSFMQIVFSPYLNNKQEKRSYLLGGIILRVAALLGLGLLLYMFSRQGSFGLALTMIFILITIFSLGGAFAAISYTDIIGKSMLEDKRKAFFSLRQALMSVGVFVSALLAAKMLNSYNYPMNYSALFLTAGVSLAIATLGFWMLREVRTNVVKIKSIKAYFKTLRIEINKNPRLRGYLLLVNTLGISLTLLPFLMLYSKQNFDAGNEQVGQYLIFKVSAGVIAGLLVFYFAKKVRYKYMLYFIATLALIVPVHLLMLGSQVSFPFYFFAGGLIYTFYKVAMEGIILEVSTNENRAIYAGLSGAGHIVPALFPIFGGWIIHSLGFTSFFIVFLGIIFLSTLFIWKLDCRK